MTKLYRSVAVLLALALVAAACGASENASETFDQVNAQIDANNLRTIGSASTGAPTEAEVKDSLAATAANALGDGGIDAVVVPIDFGRDIIYVANLSVSVNDVAVASREATRIIQGLGRLRVWPTDFWWE